MTNRKFNLTVGIILLNFGLLLWSKISSDQWINICLIVLGAYLTGNVTQRIFSKGE